MTLARTWMVLAALLGFTVAGCGGGASSPTPIASPTTAPGGGGSPSPTPTSSATAQPTQSPSPAPTNSPSPTPSPAATPLVVHIGFQYNEFTDPTYGPVWYYSSIAGASQADVINVASGSQVVFENDSSPSSPHTASGLGTGPFPPSFDNTSGLKKNGTVIDGSLTWSTGLLTSGQRSQVFTVGPPGTYYFGCGIHYTVPPTKTNQSMGDVLVSH